MQRTQKTEIISISEPSNYIYISGVLWQHWGVDINQFSLWFVTHAVSILPDELSKSGANSRFKRLFHNNICIILEYSKNKLRKNVINLSKI